MNRWHRRIVRLAVLLAAGAILIPVAHAGGNAGDVNLAKGVLESQFGFSPSRATDWTTGVCSYADKPSSCYLTPTQAKEQSYAQARSIGALAPDPTPTVAGVGLSPGFQWNDAGIGAGATLGLVLIVAGIGAAAAIRNRRRTPIHA
jgi:hypothetical protein